jgi:hypothetical protein
MPSGRLGTLEDTPMATRRETPRSGAGDSPDNDTGDLATLKASVRALIDAMPTGPRNYAKIADLAEDVVKILRGSDGYDTIGTKWNDLNAAARLRLRQMHNALCGSAGAYNAIRNPEEVEQLAKDVLALSTQTGKPHPRKNGVIRALAHMKELVEKGMGRPSKSEIARAIGVDHSLLSRDKRFRQAYELFWRHEEPTDEWDDREINPEL